VSGNPVDGVKRPMANGNERYAGAGRCQARKLLEAPPDDTSRACAIAPSSPPCSITACAARSCAGCGSGTSRAVRTFSVRGQARQDQVRSPACDGAAADRGIPGDRRPRRRRHRPHVPSGDEHRTGELDRPLDPASVYRNIVRKYGLDTGISAEVNGLCVHSLRAMAATNALSHEADIAKVQEWLGHANVSTGSTTGAKCGPRTARRSG